MFLLYPIAEIGMLVKLKMLSEPINFCHLFISIFIIINVIYI